jgi:hypothetical protein
MRGLDQGCGSGRGCGFQDGRRGEVAVEWVDKHKSARRLRV